MLVEGFLPALSIVSGIFVLAPILFYVAPFVLLFLLLNHQPVQTSQLVAVPKALTKPVALISHKFELVRLNPSKAVAVSRAKSISSDLSPDFLISSFFFDPVPITYHLLPVFASLPPTRVLREVHERAPPLTEVLI